MKARYSINQVLAMANTENVASIIRCYLSPAKSSAYLALMRNYARYGDAATLKAANEIKEEVRAKVPAYLDF